MDPVKQTGKGLRETQQRSDFVVKRPLAHFPAVEKVVDGISATTPFDMEFKTYRKDDNVLLTINFIGSTVFTPACPYRTPGFGEWTPYDVFGARSDWAGQWWGVDPAPVAIRTSNGLLDPYGAFFSTGFNGGGSGDFGIRPAVFSGPVGPWFVNWAFQTPGAPSICMVQLIGPAWSHGGPDLPAHIKDFTLEGGGNTLYLDGTVQSVNWGPNGDWNLHYSYYNSHEGLFYYPGESMWGMLMWGTYPQDTVP